MAREAFEVREQRHLAEGRGTTKIDLGDWMKSLERRLKRVVGKTNISSETVPPEITSAYGPYQPGVVEHISPPRFDSMNDAAAMATFTGPALDALQETILRNSDNVRNLNGVKLADDLAGELGRFLDQKWGEMSTNKIASVRWAETMRDHSLLNYSNQYGANP